MTPAVLGGDSAGEPQQAARWAAVLFGAVHTILASIDGHFYSVDRIEYDLNIAATRAALDNASFAAAWEEGRAMSMEQAIEYALNES